VHCGKSDRSIRGSGHSGPPQFALKRPHDRKPLKADLFRVLELQRMFAILGSREVATMPDRERCWPVNGRTPWNKGRLIGARPPLRSKNIWAIRNRLVLQGKEWLSQSDVTRRSANQRDSALLHFGNDPAKLALVKCFFRTKALPEISSVVH
jgi:hypothetical protein